ncbi:protein STPG3 isoform X3 [Anolis carolinensis]|uniref:protein STPG3 isoform X3 n=1 Tax=Anolis carolinensis TaxID=28377 RepID=UPI002F2B5977
MEYQLIHTKFLAQKYLNKPLLYKRHPKPYRALLGGETHPTPLFPDIHPGKQSKAPTEGRLQFVMNVDSPGPAAYPPPVVNCRESNAPAYTFGWKTPPKGTGNGKDGSVTMFSMFSISREYPIYRLPNAFNCYFILDGAGRRSWQKSWFQSKNPFNRKTDYTQETNWPSPFDYGPTLGSMLVNRPTSPNFTMGRKGEFSWVNKTTVDDPAPNRYNTDRAYKHVLFRSPSFIMAPAQHIVFGWAKKDLTPGPGAYDVEKGHCARLPNSPSFYIQGVRRPKKHETGPFSTL